MVSLVIWVSKSAGSLTDMLNGFLNGCIKRTSDLLKTEESMQRRSLKSKTKGALDKYLQ